MQALLLPELLLLVLAMEAPEALEEAPMAALALLEVGVL